ncbi:uncharacterized protein LOC118433602 [Folsomia candida]|uniref:uncharacterized protein LOC118433602 n=1 Tax=Folsomia candida TaxID=158441 RepID=UPI0016050997|nr:uncharacterized protein LOC118433602 [Folsomia candida]
MEGDIVPYVMGLPVTNNIPAQGLNQHVSPFAALANFSKQDAFVAEMFLHYVANFVKSGRIDSNEVEVEIRGGGGESVVPLSSSPGMTGTTEYDFTTALTVTITVGVALIALNLVVFSAIMCHRKRAIPTNNEGDRGSRDSDEVDESGRSSGGGTPQKGGVAQYQQAQEDYKWSTACCSSSNHQQNHPHPQQELHPNDFPTTHLSSSSVYMPAESISMSQYHQQHQHHFHPGNSGGGTLPRSSHGHQGHHLAYETHTGGGTLKRGTYHHNGNHILAIPDCV